EPVRDDVARVLEDGERQLVSVSVAGNVGDGVVLVGVDADEGDAAVLELGGQVGQAGAVQLCQGAIDAEEDDDDELAVVPFAQAALGPAVVAEGEVLDAGAWVSGAQRGEQQNGDPGR